MLQKKTESLPAAEQDIQDTVLDIFHSASDKGHGPQDIDERIDNILSEYLNERNVTSDLDLATLAYRFQNFKIPEIPEESGAYMDYLQEYVIQHAVHTSSPRYIGHMTAALPGFVKSFARLLTVLNQNVVKLETSKALSPYEREALAMLHRLIYHNDDSFYDAHVQAPESTLGIMTSGGTVANITALWCARNARLHPEGDFQGVEMEGMAASLERYGYRDAVIIGSDLMHYSMKKAADIMGIGLKNLVRIPVDTNFRADVDQLKRAVDQAEKEKKLVIAVVGVAGSTDSGSIDDLRGIGEFVHQHGIHFHVDAAWGGPLLFSSKNRALLDGIEFADSVTVDGHKQLFIPMGNGMVFFRDPHVAACIEKNAKYVVRTGSTDLGKRSLEGSRPAMALYLHTALHLIGRKGYEYLIDEGIRKTRFMAEAVKSNAHFQLLIDPQINLLLYRYIPSKFQAAAAEGRLRLEDQQEINAFNEHLQKNQRKAGKTFISRTSVKIEVEGQAVDVTALRAVIANILTRPEDITEVLKDQMEIALTLENE